MPCASDALQVIGASPLLVTVKVCGVAVDPQFAEKASDCVETAIVPAVPEPERTRGAGRGAHSVPVGDRPSVPVNVPWVGGVNARVSDCGFPLDTVKLGVEAA